MRGTGCLSPGLRLTGILRGVVSAFDRSMSRGKHGSCDESGAPDGLRSRDLRLDRAMRTPGSSTGACSVVRAPNGIRTRAAAVKGRCPRPLDDGGLNSIRLIQGKNKGPKPFVFVPPSCSELDL